MGELLDFELEDDVVVNPTKKRKKIIGLDDLLSDHYKQKGSLVENSRRATHRRSYSSDEDEVDVGEAKLSRCVEECQKEMGRIYGEDESAFWGLQIFGDQKPPPKSVSPDLKTCVSLESLKSMELDSLVEVHPEKGETFLERLLVDGWLLKLVLVKGHLNESIAKWTFNLMLYSSIEVLSTSACDFWCTVLSPKNKTDLSIKIDWMPKYTEVKEALEIYGFIINTPSKFSSTVNLGDSDHIGPPQNIRAWMKFIAAGCQVRSSFAVFSTSETEELLAIVISLYLDRQLLGLSMILHDCTFSVLNYFRNNEWKSSCEKVAISIASRVPCDINSLRIVESIMATDSRSKQLRSAVAYQLLSNCFDNKFTDAEDMLAFLISINVKDNSCDLFKIYIYLVLTENWLLYNSTTRENSLMKDMWGVFLRNCSCQISSTDLRSHASKVRSKASYLVQGSLK
ncbi:hypothetical protein ACET3Z_019628 [Daucus carota]